MTLPLFESYRELPLSQGKVALVDAEDYERISQHKWYAWSNRGRFYAVRSAYYAPGKRRLLGMHRQVMGLDFDDPRIVDHRKQSETLDNRRQNLRIGTRGDNQHNQRRNARNTTGFKGVGFYPKVPSLPYRTVLMFEGKQVYLGHFLTAEEAGRAYDRKAIELFGEFAHVNFPRSEYPELL